jgi:hypothetical protein
MRIAVQSQTWAKSAMRLYLKIKLSQKEPEDHGLGWLNKNMWSYSKITKAKRLKA